MRRVKIVIALGLTVCALFLPDGADAAGRKCECTTWGGSLGIYVVSQPDSLPWTFCGSADCWVPI